MLKYLHRQWIARPLAVFSVCFLAGICLCTKIALPLIPVTLGAFGISIAHIQLKKHGIRLFVLPMIAAVLFGSTRMLAETKLNPSVPEKFSICFSGTVVSDPYYNASSERIICIFRIHEMDGVQADYKVRLYLRSDELELAGIEYGQTLDCFGHVWPQESATNPYQYDALNALRADGLDGMAAAKLEDISIHPAKPSPGRFRIRILHAISDQIDLLFPKNADLVRAFVLGDRAGLDQETRDAFSQTGVSHLICISGLHISTVAMAVSRLLSIKFARKAAVLGTLTAIFFYGVLIGFPASLIRAAVMFAVYSFAPIVGSPSDPISRLSAAMLGMLLVAPFYVHDAGFVLSFSASAGILLLTEPIECLFCVDGLRRMKPHPRRTIRLLQKLTRYSPLLLCTTLAAQLATLPAVIAYFGSQPLISIPVNLLSIPLAMLAYPLALIALTVSAVIMPIGQLIAFAADGIFSCLTGLIDFFAALSVGELRSPTYPDWLVLIHWIIVLLSSGLNRIPLRFRRFLPIGLAALVGISMINAWIHTLGFTAVFLDAGQADAAVIKTEGHVYVFDAGDDYSPMADYVSGSCLGVNAVFLSHPHADHAGGLAELLEKLPLKVIYVPEGWFEVEATDSVSEGINSAIAMGIPIIELAAGDELILSENTSLRVHESANPDATVNDLSMLLEVQYRDRKLFFTGDLSTKHEPEILPDIDILKVPHHGSGKAASDRFLSLTSPGISIISVGENNYGHPSSETLERLSAAGSTVYRTDECGAIELCIRESGEIRAKTYLPMEESE